MCSVASGEAPNDFLPNLLSGIAIVINFSDYLSLVRQKLKELLEEMVGILETLKVTGCIAGLSGPVDPATIQKVTSLKNKLSAPDFWSEYHFIEENGQKTE